MSTFSRQYWVDDDPPLRFSLLLGLLSEYGFQYPRDRGTLLGRGGTQRIPHLVDAAALICNSLSLRLVQSVSHATTSS